MNVPIVKSRKNALQHPRSQRRPWGAIIEFLGPAVLMYLAFRIIPLLATVYNSFHTLETKAGEWVYTFVGLEHYIALFGDARFRLAMRNSVYWAVTAPLLEIPIAFVLAYIVHQRLPLRRFYRVLWFLPMLFSWVAIGAIFRWVFNADWGVLNLVLRPIGLDHNWLGDIDTAIWSLIGVTTWRFIGFNFIILLAALGSIPQDIFDAAAVDGTNQIQRIVRVVLPMIRPTFINLMLLCYVGKMRVFDLVWVMTRGAPLGYTETVGTYVQKRAFEWQTFDLGYPSAIAVVWFIIVFVSWLLLSRWLQRREALEF